VVIRFLLKLKLDYQLNSINKGCINIMDNDRIKWMKEDIIKDVLNIARLNLNGGYLNDKGELELLSGYDVQDMIKTFQSRITQTAKNMIIGNPL
jgi:hypothetical protein